MIWDHKKVFSLQLNCCLNLLGLRNLPRPLLVAGPSNSGSTDADGGLFAVPTTLPPNSRHGKLFLPSKEAELTFRQHLDTISVSEVTGREVAHCTHAVTGHSGLSESMSFPGKCAFSDVQAQHYSSWDQSDFDCINMFWSGITSSDLNLNAIMHPYGTALLFVIQILIFYIHGLRNNFISSCSS